MWDLATLVVLNKEREKYLLDSEENPENEQDNCPESSSTVSAE